MILTCEVIASELEDHLWKILETRCCYWQFMVSASLLGKSNLFLWMVFFQMGRRQTRQLYPLLKYRYRGSFPSDYIPTIDYDTFANINMQPSKMQVAHWIMIGNSCQKMSFADSLGRKKKFLQAALRADYARTTIVPSQRLRLLHDKCRFISLQIPTRRNH